MKTYQFITETQTTLMQDPVAEGENWSKHNNKRAGGMSKECSQLSPLSSRQQDSNSSNN
jgi:hypothetical protein